MIGAGFSKNADKTLVSAADFPLWSAVADAMYRELYPPPSDPPPFEYEKAKLKAISGIGAVRVASEYEAAFGRKRLDALLLRAIRDDAYMPGDIHRLLLTLPWSDIFTTNYDTLLERTRRTIVDRRYDLLLTSADIPGRMKPRIVKLHGSFPSHRPFISTEEDYRTYPQQFAPFVNSVQQAIMENSFCLLGFSGDDPNFLYWSGWVRDNLGSAASNIYLCGLLNLSDSQKALLRRRNVTPIDLSPVFPATIPASNRHANAMKWFLLSLLNGAPPAARGWPSGASPGVSKPPGLPDLVPPPSSHLYDPGLLHPTIIP